MNSSLINQQYFRNTTTTTTSVPNTILRLLLAFFSISYSLLNHSQAHSLRANGFAPKFAPFFLLVGWKHFKRRRTRHSLKAVRVLQGAKITPRPANKQQNKREQEEASIVFEWVGDGSGGVESRVDENPLVVSLIVIQKHGLSIKLLSPPNERYFSETPDINFQCSGGERNNESSSSQQKKKRQQF